MTVKILLSIIALALSVCASAKIDYADYKKLEEAYQIPAPEAEKLSESGNPYAKLRSALDNIPYEREKSVSEIRELYEKRGLRLAGYYLSNFLKDKAEREKLLEKLAAEGDDYACSAAKCDLLFDNLKASADAADAKKFNVSFDSLLSLAKDGFQPAAVKLAFFIETNCGKIKNFRDAAAELPALYGILSRASKEMEFYQMKRGRGARSLRIFFAGWRIQFRTARAHSRQYWDYSCGVFQPRKTGNPQWRAPNNINYRLGVGKFHPRGNISHKSLTIFSRPWRRPSKRALWLIRRWNQL